MARAPADWRSVLRRAEVLVRRRDMRSFDLLLPALRWRSLGARNRAVILLARMAPVTVPLSLWRLKALAPPPSGQERPTRSAGSVILGPSHNSFTHSRIRR